MDIRMLDIYHTPKVCTQCGGVMVFRGVGEYSCEDCGQVDYDDYGKVRLYLESHPGASAVVLEKETGVAQKTIRTMIKEARIQVAEGSQTYLHCEFCGKNIRCGRYCTECEVKIHRNAEERARVQKKIQGYGKDGAQSESGHRRFMRDGQ